MWLVTCELQQRAQGSVVGVSGGAGEQRIRELGCKGQNGRKIHRERQERE